MAVLGFRELGAPKHESLMKRANDLFLKIRDDLEKFNDGTIEGFAASYKDNPLGDLDKVFFELWDIEVLSKIRIAYIREHLDEFIDPPPELPTIG